MHCHIAGQSSSRQRAPMPWKQASNSRLTSASGRSCLMASRTGATAEASPAATASATASMRRAALLSGCLANTSSNVPYGMAAEVGSPIHGGSFPRSASTFIALAPTTSGPKAEEGSAQRPVHSLSSTTTPDEAVVSSSDFFSSSALLTGRGTPNCSCTAAPGCASSDAHCPSHPLISANLSGSKQESMMTRPLRARMAAWHSTSVALSVTTATTPAGISSSPPMQRASRRVGVS
mmetsp:Transcript_32560/g.58287  ORF Transcript_32560/g.58287 Transcript_32560/m.58287 type:complete len:235 (-) Transcript_32560:1516-2220(-)